MKTRYLAFLLLAISFGGERVLHSRQMEKDSVQREWKKVLPSLSTFPRYLEDGRADRKASSPKEAVRHTLRRYRELLGSSGKKASKDKK